MSEDAAAGTAPEGTAPAEGTPAPAADAGGDPAEMLASALSDEGDDDAGSDDPTKQLAKMQDELSKWKEMSRRTEAAAKKARAEADKNATAARKLAEIEDRDKSESQRNAERATAAEQRAQEAEAKYHRTLAAATYGLPPSLIDRISGGSEDEINESAEQLAAAINEAAEQRTTAARSSNGAPARPVESLRPGAIPASSGGSPTDPNALFRQLMGQR